MSGKNEDYITRFERYLENLEKCEYELLIEKAYKIAKNVLKEKQLTS